MPQVLEKDRLKVVFAKLSPFEVAMYDIEANMVVIDKAFEGNGNVVKWIMAHEEKHHASRLPVDFHVEINDRTPSDVRRLTLRAKPLSMFSFLKPFASYVVEGERFYSYDLQKLLLFAIFVFGTIFLVRLGIAP